MTVIKMTDELKGEAEIITDFQRFKHNLCTLNKAAVNASNKNHYIVKDAKGLTDFLGLISEFYK